MPRFLLVLCLCLAVLPGCKRSDTPRKAVPTQASTEERAILIGLIPEQNIFKQTERYEPLAKYLSKKTGIDIRLKILPRYGNIIDNFVSSNLDGAFFGSFTYALAHAKLGLEVLARPEALDGTSTYHGLIFVRKDSHIRSARDMKGKRFAFVDKATTAGYLLPLEYFRENHIRDYRRYFKETYFTGTHEDAIYDVLNRKADVGAAKNTIFDKLAAADIRLKDDLVILAHSPDVPENALAVRKDLDRSIKEGLRKALLDMKNDQAGREVLQAFGAVRFIETAEEDYKPVLDYARHIKLDLATYDYMNE